MGGGRAGGHPRSRVEWPCVQLRITPTPVTGPGTFTSSSGPASATITSSVSPQPSVSASVSISPSTALAVGGAYLTLTYWGEVEGPSGPPVTVDFTTSATTSSTDSSASGGVASATITSSGGNAQEFIATTSGLDGTPQCPTTCPTSFSITASFQNTPNELFEVVLYGLASTFPKVYTAPDRRPRSIRTFTCLRTKPVSTH
jgi:hypothetical protein